MTLPIKKKDLTYSSYDEFNKKSNFDFSNLDFNKPNICNSLLRLYDEGMKNMNLGEDEKAYMLLLRFFEGYIKLKSSKMYKADPSFVNNFISKEKLARTMSVLENLKTEIKQRYEEKENQLKSDSKIELIQNDTQTEITIEEPIVKITPKSINPTELVNLIRQNCYKILIIDIRDELEFTSSHMNLDLLLTNEAKKNELVSYINIPNNLIETTSWKIHEALAKKQDLLATKLFMERNNFDYLILFDGLSSFNQIKPDSKLLILKRAVYEFDFEKVKNEPIVLDGGWSQWLVFYPVYKTNTSNTVVVNRNGEELDKNSIKNKFNFEYPEIPTAPKEPDVLPINNIQIPIEKPTELDQEKSMDITNEVLIKPLIDRSSKPGLKNKENEPETNKPQSVSIPIVNRSEKPNKDFKPIIDENNKPGITLRQIMPINNLNRIDKPDLKTYETNPINDVIFNSIYAPSRFKIHTPLMKEGANKVLNPETGMFSYQPIPEGDKERVKKREVKLSEVQDSKKGSSGLKRTISSPNIANLDDIVLNEEKDKEEFVDMSFKTLPKPVVNRTNKPAAESPNFSHIEELQPVYAKTHPGLTGIRNLGNTCFMNSIIQCLSNTEKLAKFFSSGQFKKDLNRKNDLGFKGEIADEFALIIHSIWTGHCRIISPRRFKYIIGQFNQTFVSNEQQDAQEFLLFLLDGLHEDLNRVRIRPKINNKENESDKLSDLEAGNMAWKTHLSVNNSIIVDLFQGLFKSTVACSTCDKKSVKFDAFMYLTLPIPSSKCDIYDCLEMFLRRESMSGESKWKCPSCKQYRDATKKIDIWKLPPLLIVHLKRFKYEGVWRDKITSNVDYPIDDLNLNKYIIGPNKQIVNNAYKLYAISNHSGTMDGGHYTSLCRNFQLDRWFKYDDSEVKEITSFSSLKSPTSYILFYARL